ncbi:glycosyltransferase family 39 protein [Thermomonospora amylolytica]|uniref:glycosyltransferase family 39 protein n=1 Tax=Thermomonospora amylolytica TaxID=1411117 RepID=UPI000E6C507C|nr:glycosyltransferase family 39 protein [Thermomonospora amylolytica]
MTRDPVRWAVPAVPALAALAVGLWRITVPPLWRDEAATLSAAAERSLPDLLRLLGNIDAVHGLYYLFMHVWTAVFGTGHLAIRLPSALALAVAAAVVAALGRRLADARVGLVAGLLVAASPVLSRYAQEARQYTIATALAAVSTYLLVRALEARTRRWFAGYAVSVALVGWIQLFTLLILPAHLAALWTVRRDRALLIRWAPAAAAGTAAFLPVLPLALEQRTKQVNWITAPDAETVQRLLDAFAGDRILIAPVVVLAVVAWWRRPSPGAPVDLRILATAWAVLPPALLLAVSLVEPVYWLRYVIFAVPGVALLTAMGLRAVPLWGAVPALAAMLALTVPMHLEVRTAGSRPDDVERVARIIAEHRRPGDGLVFEEALYRRIVAADPAAYAGLSDLTLDRPADQVADLQGSEISDVATLRRRAAGLRRVWYVDRSGLEGGPGSWERVKDEEFQRSEDWDQAGRWRFRGGTVYLYERR